MSSLPIATELEIFAAKVAEALGVDLARVRVTVSESDKGVIITITIIGKCYKILHTVVANEFCFRQRHGFTDLRGHC